MDVKKLSKEEIRSIIEKAFSKNPSQNDIKKIKRLAASKNIKLGEKRKKFCKKCYTFFDSDNSSIKIRSPHKIITCKRCGYVSRYKVKDG